MIKATGLYVLPIWLSVTLIIACNPKENTKSYRVSENKYARGFAIQSVGNLKILDVFQPWGESNDTFRYTLFPRDTSSAKELSQKGWIAVPISRTAVLSSTHIGPLLLLSQSASIVAVHDLNLIYNRSTLKENFKISELGNDQNPSVEGIIASNADVIFSFGVNGSFLKLHKELKQSGVHLIPIAEYLEDSPLAQAEWIKFFSEFYDARSLSDSIFQFVDSSYNAIKTTNRDASTKAVLMNFPWEGVWYLPGEKSCIRKLIEDAGGNPVFSDRCLRGSYPASLEEVIAHHKESKYWLNPGSCVSLSQLKSMMVEAEYFRSVKEGQVYNHSKRTSGLADDYFEIGIVRPDLVLQDLSLIFSDLANDSNLIFYSKIR